MRNPTCADEMKTSKLSFTRRSSIFSLNRLCPLGKITVLLRAMSMYRPLAVSEFPTLQVTV